jgi:N-ethylmaleimide reductase
MSTASLFQPLAAGPLSLPNRIAMAPMTRSRALHNLPNALMADYYRQRNQAGLIITEGTAPSPEGLGYPRIPGLFDQAQQQAWAPVVAAGRAQGARMVVQLMHTGRIAHRDNLPAGSTVLAPSAVRAAGQVWTDTRGLQDHDEPTAMDAGDIARVVADFAAAARRARAAGFDGVEIHAANGYLPAQFLNPRSNLREDGYGGSAAGRQRFLLELVDAVSAAIGRERVGVRLSPFNPYNDLEANYPGEAEETLALVAGLSARRIGYLHLIATPAAMPAGFVEAVRKAFTGVLVLAGDFEGASAAAAIAEGRADVVAFARHFIANPDLPRRLREGLPLAGFDGGKLFSADAAGYNDYPGYAAPPLAA